MTIRSFNMKMLLSKVTSWKHLREACQKQALLLDCIHHSRYFHIITCIRMHLSSLWNAKCIQTMVSHFWIFVIYTFTSCSAFYYNEVPCVTLYRGAASLTWPPYPCIQLPLPKWAMWRWRGSAATELPLSVGPHSPSIRQEGSLCTLWLISPLHKLGKRRMLTTLSTPIILVW